MDWWGLLVGLRMDVCLRHFVPGTDTEGAMLGPNLALISRVRGNLPQTGFLPEDVS